jgi:hypothetical protein
VDFFRLEQKEVGLWSEMVTYFKFSFETDKLISFLPRLSHINYKILACLDPIICTVRGY